MNLSKKVAVLFCVFFIQISTFSVFSQTVIQTNSENKIEDNPIQSRPKLVIGIVIDQMRYDYLYRFYDQYSENGFKRLLNDGFSCENTHYNYTPTNTAPGHASIFTGATPMNHGIINNNWYSRAEDRKFYCAEDQIVEGIGTENPEDKQGKMSPRNLKTSTITDELRLATNQKAKVIGISIKDRGAIMPAGHIANGAYWYDGSSGKMISSSYYFENLPNWVTDFNKKEVADKYIKQGWELLLPLTEYSQSLADENKYEGHPTKNKKAVFPYFIDKFNEEKRYKEFLFTASANTFLREFAEEAILKEELGKDKTTDFLTLSFSSTDYIGHRYGIYSVEVQDTYLRLDKELATLFEFLDKNVGEGEYTLFLTADHAGAPSPSHLHDLQFDSDYLEWSSMKDSLNNFLIKSYGEGKFVSYLSDQDVFLNRELLLQKNISLQEVQQKTSEFLLTQKGISQAITATELSKQIQRTGFLQLIQNGFNPKLSPDVAFLFQSGYMDSYYKKGGTTHGTPYNYDTQVPLLFFGKNIKSGKTHRRVEITDIAATMASLLYLQQPSGCIGNPIIEIFE
ncbi:putative AP superfamily protein [Bernardetia litoralis DSM 6794]|uniref:Putative AP superfamily protein n=1 Tax=Bernardetia litoralis (strain ATCC 23117 / DSM 6794 / NBRC 15988 / NCIMB 1366 / Fx l1 / Sio-4) TaxID=880071 RepID=I4AG20_BERLS|nr:alkaline phosphatase PafA [Bernardetia litoralis]AFM02905.1 putative AP superfamily protein [Bernardetia litoralis DSM 6794]